MRTIKRAYAGAMHAVVETGGLSWLEDAGMKGDFYGLARWAASLLAIHDVERMIRLDLPWWNVAATREVADHLAKTRRARVFEYGAGASTAWLAKRAGEVFSVEHDAAWHRIISPLVETSGNARVWRRELDGEDYVGAIAEAGGEFDLIVVDGRRRIECLKRAVPHLKRGGVILFDDSGRRRYREGIASCGLRERRYFGRSFCVPYPDFSSILHA